MPSGNRAGTATSLFPVALVFSCATGVLVAMQVITPAPAGPAAGAAPLPTEGTSALSGMVVDGNTGRPIAGAIVSLGGPFPIVFTPTPTPSRGLGGRPARQITDATGRFVFTRLPGDVEYNLAATRVGYADGGFGRETTLSGRRIPLADGEWFGDARITLYRHNALSGTVLDEAGEPMVGVFVRALTRAPVAGRIQLVAGPAAKTDDRGAYRIPGLPAGQYLVETLSVQTSLPTDMSAAALVGMTEADYATAIANGRGPTPREDATVSVDAANRLVVGTFTTPPALANGRSQAYPITFYPNSRTIAEAQTITLAEGQEQHGVDFQLRPVDTVRVSGVLTGPPGSQAGGMTMRLLPAGLEALSRGSEAATAFVRPDGTFAFLNVPAGDYVLNTSRSSMEYTLRSSLSGSAPIPTAPGVGGGSSGGGVVASAPRGVDYSYMASQGTAAFSARVPLTVSNRDVTGLAVTLTRAVTISGRIVYAAPRQGAGTTAPVYAEPANGDASLGMPNGRSEGAGMEATFTVDGLLAGPYSLRFLTAPAFNLIRSITWEGQDYTYRPFDAGEGHDFTNVVVTYTDQVAKLGGFVRATSSALAKDGTVILFPIDSAGWTGYGFTPRRILTAAVSPNGAYRYTTLPAGDYYAIAVPDTQTTGWQNPEFLAAAAKVATRVTLDWNESKTIDLTAQTVTLR